MEGNTSKPTREGYNRIRTEMLARIEQLCKIKLNRKIFIEAINKHAVSLINYYMLDTSS
ncbi:hypothetical protein PAEPH01_0572 [Pancytospora epiphaga]|nr:hypothetical protein PAEPH01_0572 [Pancytospora epiphaga]